MVVQMKKGEPRFNVFERINSVKEILAPVVPDRDGYTLRGLVLRCVKYRVGHIKRLNSKEAKAYDLLLQHKLVPKTVYEWLLLEDLPQHLKEKLAHNKISLDNARMQFVQWKRLSGTRAGQDIMEEMRNIIGRLRWKSHEGLPPQY